MNEFDISDSQLKLIFEQVKTIALVGASDKPDRASYRVMAYLQGQGYRVLPINPVLEGELLGEKVYATLTDVNCSGIAIDMVDIFRRSEVVLPIVEEALKQGTPVIWMQLGVVNEQAALLAKSAGCQVVMDRCPKIELARLRVV
jgi:predicted CoA-binding protein